MAITSDPPSLPASSDPVDRLGITDDQLAILGAALPLEPIPVDPLVADRVLEPGDSGEGSLAGAVRVRCFTAPKLERATAYRTCARRAWLSRSTTYAT